MKKRILVISNNGIAEESSNGRTMMQLLKGYGREYISQFYINGNIDPELVKDAFQITDRQMIELILHLPDGKTSENEGILNSSKENKIIQRNCRNLVIRDLLWSTNLWWKKEFTNWLDQVSPEVIVFQAGDCPFMYGIAERISNRYQIPIIVYNSESYVIRKSMYYGVNANNVWHIILKNRLKRNFKRLFSKTIYTIYITETLAVAYNSYLNNKEYPYGVLMTSSNAKHFCYIPRKNRFIVSYCGNIGGGRDRLLSDFAVALLDVYPKGRLVICGGKSRTRDFENLLKCPNVIYKGVVSYDEVQSTISSSDLIIHCEDSERIESRYYGFSTKIADSLMSGIPFLVYASRKYPFTDYLEKNQVAFLCETKDELKAILRKLVNDEAFRCSRLTNAYQLALKNHNQVTNAEVFQSIIENV